MNSTRKTIAELVIKANNSIAQVALQFAVSPSTVRRYMDEYTEEQCKPEPTVQLEIEVDGDANIPFELYGCKYEIKRDTSRKALSPQWYVQRMTDLRTTKRYYSWPDGAFSAVLWERCSWEDQS
jgi:hypothetical protein